MSIGRALLVSADSEMIAHFSHALQELSIFPDVCSEVPEAVRLLNRRKFDAVIVDLQLGGESGALLDEVHLSPSNRTAVTFAITSSGAESTTALRKTSGFIFERPVSAQSIRSTFRPAYGLILREHRRYFRCPTSTPVVILRRNKPEVRCSSLNISEGGMALSTFVPIMPGEQVQVQFTLPGHDVPCLLEATACWWRTENLGVQFVSIPEETKVNLQVWLSQKVEELLPNFVSETFRKSDSDGDSMPTVVGTEK